MAAVDYFLKVDGIQGESKADKHKDEIDIESFSWGATQSGTFAVGGGGGAVVGGTTVGGGRVVSCPIAVPAPATTTIAAVAIATCMRVTGSCCQGRQ